MMQMDGEKELKFLLEKVRRNRNIDFSQYRRAVLERRLQHRLFETRCAGYLEYVMLLNQDPTEYDRLIQTLTIKVSEFFRDPKVFDYLRGRVIPEIVSRKKDRSSKRIRVWSCGAAYGEEAYSTAILFCEVLGRGLSEFDIEIVATDIDKSALARAPWGSYDKKALRRVSPHLLFKYFTRSGDRYVVNEIWDHGDGTWVGEQIVRTVQRNNYRIGTIICDPLAKGDANNENTTFDKIEQVLMRHGHLLATGSKDKQSGIIEINNHLEGPNKEPSLFFFSDLVRTLYEIEGWMYDKETQKPKKEDDDMMEGLYRILLLDTKWEPMEDEDEEYEDNREGRSAVGGY